MHLTIRQIKVFIAVAQNLNFTRAAEQLHLSQPAVSMQIKLLEDSVGLPLFEHIGKKVVLTEAGSELNHYCRGIVKLLAEADEVISALKGAKRGHLALSVTTTANYFATNLLADFKKRFPEITFSLDVTNRETVLVQLKNNEKDLVIMGKPPTEEDLVIEPFMENPLVVIAAPGHPLAKLDQVSLSELSKETFVGRESGSGTRIAYERFFADKGIVLKTGMEMNSNEVIKQAVEAGLGLGIVSVHTVALELAIGRVAIIKAEDFPILRHWYVVYRKGKRLSPVAAAFREYVFTEAKTILKLSQTITT